MDFEGLTEKRNRKGTIYYENEAGEIVAKVCRGCGEVKLLSEFSKDRRGLAGAGSLCKSCASERYRKYREENRDKIQKYREENRDKRRKYYEENRDKALDYQHKYHEENRDKVLERQRKYREENRDKLAEHNRKWREENRDKLSDYQRKYREENRDKRNLVHARRRARKRALPDTLTDKEYAETLVYFGNSCALTGEVLDLDADHAIPLAVGHAGTIRENMYPLRASLNNSKGDRNIFEWFRSNKERFKLEQAKFDRLIDYLAKLNEMTVEEYRTYVYWCHENPRSVEEIKEATAS